ncbi:MAG: respiratory chain complex I subunit 1 family protein [Palaeococcus sp.]|uniref:respiratory chain complex I subunit 1 family protein n=1 Tax=Palaeococcus sp. (in: euryarchaeotes) TaxID=2820298 RepID=UPI0025FA7F04|nr:respiratory chain complex I subunit 1 family protein [Palaeococcus sp. (in: euryarchaeotes)]MCD6558725.1 respiratory chain complex I subunit 1 family protein [Palaeococcus sp. (in: euryarchaeotes)]
MMNMIVQAVLILIYATFMGFIFMGIERKTMARIQRRIGPPLYQPLLDTLKLLGKRESITHGFIYDFGPIFALGASILALMFLPLTQNFQLFSSSGDLIVVAYLLEVPMLGIMLGAMSSGNPYSGVGVQRGLLTMVAMQLPYGLALIALVEHYGTFSLQEIVKAQQIAGWSILVPALLLAMIVFDIVFQALLGLEPFDIITAPAEISMGPMVEYGGKQAALLFTQHAVQLFAETAFFVILFLGGANNLLELLIKQIAVLFIAIFIASIYPRFTIDQAAKFLWKWPTIMGIIAALLAVL